MSRLTTLVRSRIHSGSGTLCHFHINTFKSDWFCIGRRCHDCAMDDNYTSGAELNQSIKELSHE